MSQTNASRNPKGASKVAASSNQTQTLNTKFNSTNKQSNNTNTNHFNDESNKLKQSTHLHERDTSKVAEALVINYFFRVT